MLALELLETVFSGSSEVLTAPLPPSCCSSLSSENIDPPGPPVSHTIQPSSHSDIRYVGTAFLNSQSMSTLDPHDSPAGRQGQHSSPKRMSREPHGEEPALKFRTQDRKPPALPFAHNCRQIASVQHTSLSSILHSFPPSPIIPGGCLVSLTLETVLRASLLPGVLMLLEKAFKLPRNTAPQLTEHSSRLIEHSSQLT